MKSIGRYEILSEIGRGGMGVVYLARQHGLNRLVALKELHSVHASTPDIVSRFVRESRLAGSLNHPNIVIVHDYVEEGGASYIAMEYMPRGSLRPWVGKMSLAQLAGVLEGLLAGLAAVEPASIVHRDLKPENVMVTAEGRVKIADFGIAKATQTASVVSFMTATGATVGTPAYMAPEQALAQEIGPWTDLYSVGVMAYEQLVGQLPFHDSPTPVAILMRHVSEPVPPVLDSRPDLDPALSEWVARLLVKEPAARTAGAAQAWEELEEIVIDLLGPRWRRDARLPEREGAASQPAPLTPAPFDSRAAAGFAPSPARSTPPDVGQPEIESGFLSYGRALTGVESPSAGSARVSWAAVPAAASDPAHGNANSPTSIPRVRRGRLAGRARARLLSATALIAVLTAGAGYALAPARKGPARRVRTAALAANAQRSGPSRAYAARLSDVMSTLNRERAQAGAELAHAADASAQAAAAERLAHAHAQAAAAVHDAQPGPAAQTVNLAIVTALEDVARGYATLAGAARREDRRFFDSARSAVDRATASLNEALLRLHKLGYPLAG